MLLDAPMTRLAGLYDGEVDLVGLTLREAGLTIGLGASLGLIGSWSAASRHMRAIEPG